MTNEKSPMTNFQFRLTALVAACRAAPWRLCVGLFPRMADGPEDDRAQKRFPLLFFPNLGFSAAAPSLHDSIPRSPAIRCRSSQSRSIKVDQGGSRWIKVDQGKKRKVL
jgi:hypothetical protein